MTEDVPLTNSNSDELDDVPNEPEPEVPLSTDSGYNEVVV